ncbi:ATPase [Sulfuracidifex metallicus]|uniref:ATPase n=1 Tax=Sulfuracidifex metallicus TaxID=47303 RepID=UPI002274872E|nr:ATPase [Sulfuracidifex metallicus]MCY0851062.1 ATPase [Sulfuracidifex metallicus]
MRLLINGGLPHDSGKTMFGLTLISLLREVGINLFPMKPVAGHNGWYSYSTLTRSMELGVLVGNDALNYHESTGESIEEINPFAVLFFPVDPESIERNFPYYLSLMDRGYPVMIRITNEQKSTYLQTPSHLILSSMKDVLERLISRFDPAPVREQEAWRLIENSGEIVYNNVISVLNHHKDVIIESYNNASCPTYYPPEMDYVITIVPGRAYVFDGREYSKFLGLSSLPPWLIRSEEVFRFLKPQTYTLELATSRSSRLVDFLIKRETI